MIGKLIFRLFGIEEKPGYDHVKKLSSPRLPAPPRTSEVDEQIRYIVEKHMVDGISVFTEDGTLVVTTYDEEDASHEYALFSYICDEFDGVPYAFFKHKDWILFFRKGGRVFIVHAPSYLSLAEVSALAKDIERALFGVGF